MTWTKFSVQNAFVWEDSQCRRRQEEFSSVGSALATSSAICDFCDYTGHMQDICRHYARAKEQTHNNRNQRGKNNKFNNSQKKDTASASNVAEFAENASAPSTSS
jgi:hypothetical protein